MRKSKHRLQGVTTKELVIMSVLSGVLVVGQVLFAVLPNIEIVSLLIYIYAQVYREKVFFIIYIFVLLEGCIYGFGLWWFGYLYVWSVLAIIVLLIRDRNIFKSILFSSVILGAYGLAYGFLFAIPYFIIVGWNAGVAYWVSGIPFDLLHCVGNIAVTIIIYKPLSGLIKWLNSTNFLR